MLIILPEPSFQRLSDLWHTEYGRGLRHVEDWKLSPNMNNCSPEGNKGESVTRYYLHPVLLKTRQKESYEDKEHAAPSAAGTTRVDDWRHLSIPLSLSIVLEEFAWRSFNNLYLPVLSPFINYCIRGPKSFSFVSSFIWNSVPHWRCYIKLIFISHRFSLSMYLPCVYGIFMLIKFHMLIFVNLSFLTRV